MRLINAEHFELRGRLLRSSGNAIGSIRNGGIDEHNSREIFAPVALDISSDVLNALRPSNQNRLPHTEALQQRVQILCPCFRCVPSRSLRRFALRTRIERDYPMCFCKRINLMIPNVCTCAPAGNEHEGRFATRFSAFSQPQRDTVGDIHHARGSRV